MLISADLSWTSHIRQVVEGAQPKLNLMRSLMFKLDRSSLETIYKSFIRPKIEYGNVLYQSASAHELNLLNNLEFEARRIITGAMARTSRAALLIETGWPTLQKRRHIQILNMFYMIHAGTAPTYLINILDRYKPDRVYATRNINKYLPPKCKTAKFSTSFFPKSIRLWNSLENDQRSKPTLSSFKACINSSQFRIVWNYYGQRWGNVHHARLRMGYSKLNSDLYSKLHVIQSEHCSCGFIKENATHYLLKCPNHESLRRKMLRDINLLLHEVPQRNNDLVDLLLRGSRNLDIKKNQSLFKIVQTYITDSKRFNIEH
jgi:hypothetical protein